MKRAAALAAALLLAGCAATQPALRTAAVELTGVPFYPQTAYQCGPAALATVLTDSAVLVRPDDVTSAVYLPDRKGSLQVELLAAARRFGRLPFVIAPEVAALLAELDAGRPVLVLQNLGFERFPRWHYAVVVGYLPERHRFVLRSGTRERKLERTASFLRSWKLAGNWGLVVVDGGELPASATGDSWARTVAGSEGVLDPALTQAAYRAGLARWPDEPLLLFAGANFDYGSERPRDALAGYRRLLSLQPDHAAARNNLANLLLDSGCVMAAREEIGKALAAMDPANPLMPALQDTRAQVEAAEPAASECTLE